MSKLFKGAKAWDWRNIFLAGLTSYPFLVSIYLSITLKKLIKKSWKQTTMT